MFRFFSGGKTTATSPPSSPTGVLPAPAPASAAPALSNGLNGAEDPKGVNLMNVVYNRTKTANGRNLMNVVYGNKNANSINNNTAKGNRLMNTLYGNSNEDTDEEEDNKPVVPFREKNVNALPIQLNYTVGMKKGGRRRRSKRSTKRRRNGRRSNRARR